MNPLIVKLSKPRCYLPSIKFISISILLLFPVKTLCYAGEDPGESLPGSYIKLFVDCGNCDFTYLRKEVNFVNFVRDVQTADVNLMITDKSTGSGGTEYHLSFIGMNVFAGKSFELIYISNRTDTYDEFRKGLTSVIKMGLMPFVSQTTLGKSISIEAGELALKKEQNNKEHDKWNYWVFGINTNGSYEKEESRKSYSIAAGINGSRVTENWKFRFDMSKRLRENDYTDGDDIIVSKFKEQNASTSAIKSLGRHWSAGMFLGYSSSTYTNMKNNISYNPGIEYNFFDWKECDKRELTVAYMNGLKHQQYIDTTIFGNISNNLWWHSLRTSLSMTQPWGGVYARLVGTNYPNNPDKYSVSFNTSVSLRVAKGLSIYFSNSVQSVHDQFYLPKGEATREEILLQQRKVATAYEISFYSGISYSFGSMFNNVVNERF